MIFHSQNQFMYMKMKQSMSVDFTLTSICVNPLKNPELGEPFFQLRPGVNKTYDPATNKQRQHCLGVSFAYRGMLQSVTLKNDLSQ